MNKEERHLNRCAARRSQLPFKLRAPFATLALPADYDVTITVQDHLSQALNV